jgi:hypothetical protein
MRRSTTDRCIFLKGPAQSPILTLAVYVDDVIMSGHQRDVKLLKTALAARFTVQPSGPLHWYLGIEVLRDREKGTTTLTQRKYCRGMLEAFNFLNLSASKTPASPKVSLDAVKSLSLPLPHL